MERASAKTLRIFMSHLVASLKDGLVRRLPIGAEVQPSGGVHFRVWAPNSRRVYVVLSHDEKPENSQEVELKEEPDGYWSGFVAGAFPGMFYRYRVESGVFPDPASRFQPQGPHEPSQIIDPSLFPWTDSDWSGVQREGQVIYEMHIGTFTPEGTWLAATDQLPHLAELGVTLLEVMPVADFPGKHGWGYDGVNLFAPTRLYGSPDDFRRFVDRAHALGLGVILDVVYNHLGPDGNYLREFSPHYFSDRYKNEWGDALNFDGEQSGPVREFFLANARYWIDEFHLDGLRLDAAQQIFDASPRHLLAEINLAMRAAAPRRGTYLVAEDESQESRFARATERGGYGFDSVWNDDFHHTGVVAMTGRKEAYYTDYQGLPQEFISAMKWGFLYQGQYYKWQAKRRGTPSLDLEPANFVNYLQNHDQIANSLWGRRIHTLTSHGRLRALTALLLLGPNTPMLFQGQEFAASSPFLYFADHNPELAKLVGAGRATFLKQFPSIATVEASARLPNPEDEKTFTRCKLDFADRERNAEVWRLHRDLIRLRKDDPLLGKSARGHFDGAVLGSAAFVLRFFGRDQDDRLLVINLGVHLHLDPAPEPLLAPPLNCAWEIAWSSEDPHYGGGGTPPFESEENWQLPAESAVLLVPRSL
jgi:maltooligosyltrehalose trehalohydrolase